MSDTYSTREKMPGAKELWCFVYPDGHSGPPSDGEVLARYVAFYGHPHNRWRYATEQEQREYLEEVERLERLGGG